MSPNIQQFINDFEILVKRIENNIALNDEFIQFERMMNAMGVEEKSFSDILQKNGFATWQMFFSARNLPLTNENIVAVKSVMGAIKGMGSAALEFLHQMNDHEDTVTA